MNKHIVFPLNWWVCILSLFFIGVNNVSAQAWSFEQCVEYASKKHIQNQLTSADLRSNQQIVKNAKWSWFPNVSLGGSLGLNLGRSVDPFTNEFTNKPVTSLNASSSIQLPIYQGGRRIAEYRRKRSQLRLTQHQLDQIQQMLILDLAASYLQILLAREQERNIKQQLIQSKQQQLQSKQLVEAGRLPAYYLFELEAEQLADEVRLKEAEQAFQLSIQSMRHIMQLPSDASFDLMFPDTTILLPPPTQQLEQIYTTASQQLPDLKISQIQQEQSQLGLQSAKASLLPSLSANGMIFTGYSNQRGEYSFVPGDPFTQQIGYVSPDGGSTIGNWVYAEQTPVEQTFTRLSMGQQFSGNIRRNLGFSLNIPLFNGMQMKSAIDQATIEIEKAAIRKQEVENKLWQKLERLQMETYTQWELCELNQKRLEAVKQSFAMVEEKYKLGRINLTEFLRAKNTQQEARYTFTRLKFNYLYKRKLLQFYLGEPISF